MSGRTKTRDVAGALVPPPVKRVPNKMSLLELSGTVEWKRLPSGTMRQIVAAYISNDMQSMLDSVAAVQSRSLGPERLTEIAEKVLTTPSVAAVLKVYHGKNLEQNK